MFVNGSHPSQPSPSRSGSQRFKAKIRIFRHSESSSSYIRVSKAKVIHFEAVLQVRGNMLDNLIFGNESPLHHEWLIFTLDESRPTVLRLKLWPRSDILHHLHIFPFPRANNVAARGFVGVFVRRVSLRLRLRSNYQETQSSRSGTK
jgi:hypothetical protein